MKVRELCSIVASRASWAVIALEFCLEMTRAPVPMVTDAIMVMMINPMSKSINLLERSRAVFGLTLTGHMDSSGVMKRSWYKSLHLSRV